MIMSSVPCTRPVGFSGIVLSPLGGQEEGCNGSTRLSRGKIKKLKSKPTIKTKTRNPETRRERRKHRRQPSFSDGYRGPRLSLARRKLCTLHPGSNPPGFPRFFPTPSDLQEFCL